MLDDLEDHVDTTGSRLKQAMRKVDKALHLSEDKGSTCCLVMLLLALIVVIILFFAL